MHDWVSNIKDSYYVLGSAREPHPYPTIVRDFQRIIGIEARKEILKMIDRLPDEWVACVGEGSSSTSLFHPFLEDSQVRMIGVEAGGISLSVPW